MSSVRVIVFDRVEPSISSVVACNAILQWSAIVFAGRYLNRRQLSLRYSVRDKAARDRGARRSGCHCRPATGLHSPHRFPMTISPVNRSPGSIPLTLDAGSEMECLPEPSYRRSSMMSGPSTTGLMVMLKLLVALSVVPQVKLLSSMKYSS